MLIDDCVFGGASGFDYIVEGFDRLPRTLFKFLGSNIHFASKVSSVKTFSKNTKVQVNASCSGVNCYKSKNDTYYITFIISIFNICINTNHHWHYG